MKEIFIIEQEQQQKNLRFSDISINQSPFYKTEYKAVCLIGKSHKFLLEKILSANDKAHLKFT
jgi:hypothetical protein